MVICGRFKGDMHWVAVWLATIKQQLIACKTIGYGHR